MLSFILTPPIASTEVDVVTAELILELAAAYPESHRYWSKATPDEMEETVERVRVYMEYASSCGFLVPFREKQQDYGNATVMAAMALILLFSVRHEIRLCHVANSSRCEMNNTPHSGTCLGRGHSGELFACRSERAFRRMAKVCIPLRAERDPQMILTVCRKDGTVLCTTRLCFPCRSGGRETIEPEIPYCDDDLKQWLPPEYPDLHQVQLQRYYDIHYVYKTVDSSFDDFVSGRSHEGGNNPQSTLILWTGMPSELIYVKRSFSYKLELLSHGEVVQETTVTGRQILKSMKQFMAACATLIRYTKQEVKKMLTWDGSCLMMMQTGLACVNKILPAAPSQCYYEGCDGEGGNTLMCARCMLVQYCSKSCQKADWNRHKSADCVPLGVPALDVGGVYIRFAKHNRKVVIDMVGGVYSMITIVSFSN